MKSTFIAVLLLTLSSQAKAWEFTHNPDRFPSVGVNVTNAELKGTRTETDVPGTFLERNSQSSEGASMYALSGDVRLPVTESLTFNVTYASLQSDGHFTRNDNVYKQSSNLHGYSFGAGVRLYFNK